MVFLCIIQFWDILSIAFIKYQHRLTQGVKMLTTCKYCSCSSVLVRCYCHSLYKLKEPKFEIYLHNKIEFKTYGVYVMQPKKTGHTQPTLYDNFKRDVAICLRSYKIILIASKIALLSFFIFTIVKNENPENYLFKIYPCVIYLWLISKI